MSPMKMAVDYGVIGIPVLMSAGAPGIALERWITFRKVKAEKVGDRRNAKRFAGPFPGSIRRPGSKSAPIARFRCSCSLRYLMRFIFAL